MRKRACLRRYRTPVESDIEEGEEDDLPSMSLD